MKLISSILLVFLMPLFGDFANELEEKALKESYSDRLTKKIYENDKILQELFTRNLNCIEGTRKMMSNKTCYSTFLAIQDVMANEDREYSPAQQRDMIQTLAKQCPKWQEYEIEECK
jgi:hypothetical protein